MIRSVWNLPYWYIWYPIILIAAFAFLIWAVSPYIKSMHSEVDNGR